MSRKTRGYSPTGLCDDDARRESEAIIVCGRKDKDDDSDDEDDRVDLDRERDRGGSHRSQSRGSSPLPQRFRRNYPRGRHFAGHRETQ